ICQVNEKGMDGPQGIYDFKMAYPCMGSDGLRAHKKFIISAGKMGNESRYFNHSCAPNMNTMTTIVDRYGLFYNRIAFFTDRKILPGEELVFDYFPDNKVENTDISKMFPNGCSCSTSQCRWPPGKITVGKKEVKWVREEEKEEDEGRERKGRRRRRDEVEDDEMMPVDEDLDGDTMRYENDDDGMDSDGSPVAGPSSRSPRRR
ncbi:hypothetical protein PENTCL1PPCAC_3041, partial [Pristionchus entomophagus]